MKSQVGADPRRELEEGKSVHQLKTACSMPFTDEERERNGKRFGETGWIEIWLL